MKIEKVKRPKFEMDEKTHKFNKVGEEETIIATPDKGKCFMNKKTEHKFIHTVTGEGLPIPARTEKELKELYKEVAIEK